MSLTFDEAIENHRKMWKWIYEQHRNGEHYVLKLEYFKSIGVPKSLLPLNKCYCCEYASQFINETTFSAMDCKHCPLEWEEEDRLCPCKCECGGSPFKDWLEANEDEDIDVAEESAYAIMNLHPRELYEDDI